MGVTYYLMEQLCSNAPYEQFEKMFPLDENDYSTKIFHICARVCDDQEEKANKLLLEFNSVELELLSGKEVQLKEN